MYVPGSYGSFSWKGSSPKNSGQFLSFFQNLAWRGGWIRSEVTCGEGVEGLEKPNYMGLFGSGLGSTRTR